MIGLIKGCFKYWNTIRYLKLIQIFARLKYFLPNPKINKDRKNNKNEIKSIWKSTAKKSQRMLSLNTFNFLNEVHEISSNDWNSSRYSKLWLYNLHYFDDLTSFQASKRFEWHKSYLNQWIKENPPFKGVGWEPYPISLRIVNWIKWSLNGNNLKETWLLSLEIQARYLFKNIEYHLLGNHIFANAKALIFAGLFFKGKEANCWYVKGKKILEKELSEQILSDGGNFELSPMYHSIFLEDVLDLVNIHRVYEKQAPSSLEEYAPLMLKWLKVMCHPDGKISFFNDSAFEIAPSVKELEHYSERLNFKKIKSNKERITYLNNSGYARVELANIVGLLDRSPVGPDYLPAHSHADTLSFELSIYKQRVIVNSGTSIYGDGDERHRQRGTNSHSTVTIDNENSSEVWGGFRVARRAKILKSSEFDNGDKITLKGSHNGFHRLKGRPTHSRKWEFFNDYLIIEDQINGHGIHDVDIIFPLHPIVKLLKSTMNEVLIGFHGKKIKFNFVGSGDLTIEKSTYHPEFGLSIENLKICYHLTQNLPVKLITRISW